MRDAAADGMANTARRPVQKKRGPARRAGAEGAHGESTVACARSARIEKYMPSFDVVEDRHVLVNAPPEEAYSALEEADFSKTPSVVMRALIATHIAIVNRARRRRGLPVLQRPIRLTLDDLEPFGRTKLDEAPGEEIVIGAVEQPFEWQSSLDPIPAAKFAHFARSGYLKWAASLSVRPYDAGRSLLSYEVRMRATDAKTRAAALRWWKVFRPLSSTAMSWVLGYVKDLAESRRHPSSNPPHRGPGSGHQTPA